MSQVITITGPTASGKTDLALKLAAQTGAEIVSADSMQVYSEPEIITSKPGVKALSKVKHHFIGVVSAEEGYDVFSYFSGAKQTVLKLRKQGIPVIICGGSGLYVRTLLEGIRDLPGRNERLREQLTQRAKNNGKECLYAELKMVDPRRAENIAPGDLKRIIRGLEIHYSCGRPKEQNYSEISGISVKIPVKVFGLALERDELYERINRRVDAMFARGAVAEVKKLLSLNLSPTASKIIGIEEIRGFLEQRVTEEQARQKMKQNTRNFAKRQLTWFRKQPGIEWLSPDSENVTRTIKEALTLER